MAVHQVQGGAHLVREGGGELSCDGQALLLAKFFPQEGDALEEVLQGRVLHLEFRQGVVDPSLQTGVQPLDLCDQGLPLRRGLLQLRRHEVEALRDLAQFVLPFHIGPGADIPGLQAGHGRSDRLQGAVQQPAQDHPEDHELPGQQEGQDPVGAGQVVLPHHLPAFHIAIGSH